MANTLEREILERELRPRLCYLTKGDRGYGFHLHGERNRGAQYIRKIEPGSPADLSGLRSGDRVVEVNGENVEGETHHQVRREENLLDHFTWDTDRDVSQNRVSCLHRQHHPVIWTFQNTRHSKRAWSWPTMLSREGSDYVLRHGRCVIFHTEVTALMYICLRLCHCVLMLRKHLSLASAKPTKLSQRGNHT